MARTVTLTTLQNRVKQRANVEVASSAALYTTSELNDNINEGIAEWYDRVVSNVDSPPYLESVTFTTNASTDTYIIGSGQAINVSDFYKAKGFDVTFGQNIVITARPFNWSERNRFKWYPGWIYSQPVFYQLIGKSSAVANAGQDSVKLIPAPSGQFTVTMWYIPTPPVLVGGSDAIDGMNGSEEIVVLSAASKLLNKQERFEHADRLLALKEREIGRLLEAMNSRDAENPARVQDVTLNDGWIGRPGY